MAANLNAARNAAEEFRGSYIEGKSFAGRFPIDIVFIADNVLRLDLIPFPKLAATIGSAAAITPALKEMYVDEALYSSYDSDYAPKWQKDRLRFSVAHEIGHIFMHPAHVERIRCRKISELKALFNTIDDFRNEIEGEANEFAGRLLVPVKHIQHAMAEYGRLQPNPKWRESGEQRLEFAEVCSNYYGLHVDGIKARLNRDAIWPASWATSA